LITKGNGLAQQGIRALNQE